MSERSPTHPIKAPDPIVSGARDFRASAHAAAISALQGLADQDGRSAFRLVTPDGKTIDFGTGKSAFTICVHRPIGFDALASLDALTIAHAYMDGDLDIQGDLLKALSYQERMSDFHPGIYLWRRLHPILLGRPRVNPAWIALHYDAQNAQLHAADATWHTYTPGVYSSDDEALEPGADRKLALAFEALRLERGQHLLEIGCGWGGMLRYSAQRGVHVTALTLSRRQKEYVEKLIAEEELRAEVRYQDFFTFQPIERFDAISMMGVIEDLSDYRTVMRSLSAWLKPGGRVYLDFAAERKRFDTHSFITKHIWPGTFRMVFMPEFIEAVRESPLELLRVDNDRHNYHLWARGMYERWLSKRAEIEKEHGERLWRTFLLLFAGVAATMNRPSHTATAYRVVLELPADSDGSFCTTKRAAALGNAQRLFRSLRDSLLRLWSDRVGTPPA